MRVLIVESNPDLGAIWANHLIRLGCTVQIADGQSSAIEFLRKTETDIIVLDLLLDEGSAFAVADFASYRRPGAKVIFLTNSNFFSDGSIFQHIPNACAMMQSELAPEDLGALVQHYATH